MASITLLVISLSMIFNVIEANPTPAELDKINDPLRLRLWNDSTEWMHLHNPRCGIAEIAWVTKEFMPDNENYISPGCRVIGHLMPNPIDFIFGCRGVKTTDPGTRPIKFYYTTDFDQVLDWDNDKEQRVRGDLTVVDTRVDKPDVAHVPVHIGVYIDKKKKVANYKNIYCSASW
ncbi:hypothetical protein LTR84_001131 [Exophiala bonariae]|uniref:Uncharacterized protein n=1 Tax=Exophiala bonariae TaxID=1690606 RepID=A0AAV9NSZ1_9EURO|nr:hypothetical protein LTR84_001131 [Exophiala bonariae]